MLRRVLKSSTPLWLAGFVALAVTRTGIRRMGDHQGFVDAVSAFPNITAYWRTSLLPLLVAKTFGVNDVQEWLVVHSIVTIALVAGVAVVAMRRLKREAGLVAFGLFVLGPIGTIVFGGLGFYDVWVIAGSALLALGRTTTVRVLGSLVLLGGNFELGCLALIGFLLWEASRQPRQQMVRRLIEMLGSIGVWFAFMSWIYRDAPDPDSRGEWLVNQAKGALVNSVVVFPVLLFSFFGITWIFVGRHVLNQPSLARRFLVLLPLVFIPGIMSVTTLDGTRVFVTIVAPVALAVLFSAEGHHSIGGITVTPKTLAIAALVVPALQVHMGEIINPYAELYGKLNFF